MTAEYDPVAAAQLREQLARNGASNGHVPDALVGSLASDIMPERVVWVWEGRLAEGKMTVFDGDPGLGKSTALIDIAARISTGRPFPGSTVSREARGVVVLSAEDGLADTIVPRLVVAGADLARVFCLSAVRGLDGVEMPITIPSCIPAVEEGMGRVNAQFLIVDPLMAYFGSEINAHKDQDVRRALKPLMEMLERTRAAAGMVRHMNKQDSKNAMYRGSGSIAIVGAARFGQLIARDPDNDGARVMATIKCNLGREPTSLRYGLEGVSGTDVARVVWDDDPAPWSAIDLLESVSDDTDSMERSEAEVWLEDLLVTGPRPADECYREAKKAGHGEKAIKRAKKGLRVRSTKQGFGHEGRWCWVLPQHNTEEVPKGVGFPTAGPLSNIDPLRTSYAQEGNIIRYVNTKEGLSGPKNLSGPAVDAAGPLKGEDVPWNEA